MIEITPHIIQLIESPVCAIWLSNANESNFPDLVRLNGAKVEDAKKGVLKVYAVEAFCKDILQNFKLEKPVSFVLASLQNFESYQIKGRFISYHESTEQEVTEQRTYMDGFTSEGERIGIPRDNIYKAYFHLPAITIYLQAEGIFEQTPKKGTGKKIL